MPLNPTEQAAVDRMASTTPADFDGNGYELNFPNRLNDAAIGIGAAGREIATTAASAAAAKASQDAAKASQDAAKVSETAAAGSATAAGTARTGSEGARDAAVTARQDAESARDTAQGHRTAAGNSATAAAGSATAAGDAKTAAETARDASVAARTGSETARDASVAARTAAETARDAAQAAATQSQEGATRLVGTSTTSLTASLGDKTLTTQAGKAFGVGSRVSLTNTSARVMHGTVAAYDGTSLTVAVDRVVGAGTAAEWTIRLAGQTGDKGDPGASTIGYEARSANTQIVVADQAKLIDLSGTFTQQFASPAALGAGWWCELRNNDQGDITIPASDGRTNWIMYPGEHRRFFVAEGALRSIVLKPFQILLVANKNVNVAPGYSSFEAFGISPQAGGGGGSFSTNGNLYPGGGAATGIPFHFSRIAVTAGDSFPVVIGAPGPPGANGTEGSPNGTNGGSAGVVIVAGILVNPSSPGTGATPTAAGSPSGSAPFGLQAGYETYSQTPGNAAGAVSAAWSLWSKEVLSGFGKGGEGSRAGVVGAPPTAGHGGRVILKGVL